MGDWCNSGLRFPALRFTDTAGLLLNDEDDEDDEDDNGCSV